MARAIRTMTAERDQLNFRIAEAKRKLMRLPVRPLKEWLAEEAERQYIEPNSVFCRMQAGKYPHLQKVTLNERTVLVVGNDD